MKSITCLLLVMPLSLHAGEIIQNTTASETTTSSSDWEISSAFYAPLMGLEGSVGLAGIGPFDVDSSFGDVLDVMDAGLSGAVELRKGPWSFQLDAIWLKLSDSTNPLPGTTFSFEQQQLNGTLFAGYEFYRTEATSVRFLTGATLNHLELDLNLVPPLPLPPVSRSGSQTWIDPFVGISVRHQLDDRWTVFADGLYGGFGISSEEYWQALAGFGYRLTENTSLALAYRVIAVDYQQGGFVYDTETSGPNLGLIVRF